MGLSRYIFAIVLACALSHAVATTVEMTVVLDDKSANLLEQYPMVDLVGRFRGKTYWQERQPRTHALSAEFCREIGMQLAEIDSEHEEEELQFLFDKLGGYDYWTSGIDIGTSAQFHWDVAWNVKNPIEVPIARFAPYSGIYFARNQKRLKTTSLTTSMRPLCFTRDIAPCSN